MIRKLAGVGVVAGALLLTGCVDDKPLGPAGTVVSKAHVTFTTGRTSSQVRHHFYDLTVRTPDGKTVEFDVSSTHYKRCIEGAAYPQCATKGDED